MNQNLKTVLHMVGDILVDPKRRCVGMLATDSDGFSVDPTDGKATCWCLVGALQKALHEVKVVDKTEQIESYYLMKEVIGLDSGQDAPGFWDNNESMHDTIAQRLRFA